MDYFCDKINYNATAVPVNYFVVEAALDSISVIESQSYLSGQRKVSFSGVLNLGFCNFHLNV